MFWNSLLLEIGVILVQCTVYSSPCLINAQLRVYLHLFTLLFVQILLKGSREPMLFYYCGQTQIVLQTVRTVSTVVHFRTHRSIALYSCTEFAKFSLFVGRGRIPWFVLSYFFFISFFLFFNSWYENINLFYSTTKLQAMTTRNHSFIKRWWVWQWRQILGNHARHMARLCTLFGFVQMYFFESCSATTELLRKEWSGH